jgi:hypothetical protein
MSEIQVSNMKAISKEILSCVSAGPGWITSSLGSSVKHYKPGLMAARVNSVKCVTKEHY